MWRWHLKSVTFRDGYFFWNALFFYRLWFLQKGTCLRILGLSMEMFVSESNSHIECRTFWDDVNSSQETVTKVVCLGHIFQQVLPVNQVAEVEAPLREAVGCSWWLMVMRMMSVVKRFSISTIHGSFTFRNRMYRSNVQEQNPCRSMNRGGIPVFPVGGRPSRTNLWNIGSLGWCT